MRFYLFCALGFFPFLSMGQEGPATLPASYPGQVTNSRRGADAFSFSQNPAALSFLKAASVGFFAENRFSIPGLAYGGVALAVPFKNQAAGFGVRYLGMSQAGNTEAGLSICQKLGINAAAAVQVRYRRSQAAGYGATQSLNYTLGGVGQLVPGFYFGVSLTNPHFAFAQKPKIFGEEVYQLSIGADISEALHLGFSLKQVAGTPPGVTTVLQYRIIESLLTRVGVATGSRQVFFGCGYQFKSLRIDAFTSLHPQLGFAPGLQLLFSPKGME